MSWARQKVVVTGAGGFIGSHLVEALAAAGANIQAIIEYNSEGSWGWLDKTNAKHDAEVHLADIRDQDTIYEAMTGAAVVFHLAALIAIPYSYRAPNSYIKTNVEGTANVLSQAQRHEVEIFVHTSTSEVYGTARYVPIDEAHPLQGQSPYSASKIGADQMVEAFHRSYGIPVTIVRPFNTFGPRQSARAVIPTIITQALGSDKIVLGNLNPTRDFTYVADTTRALMSAAKSPKAVGEIINVGSGKEISVGSIAATILSLTGRDVPIESSQQRMRPEASEVDRLCADIRKARDLLGWEPQYSLHDGLSITIEWMRNNLEAYRVGTYAT